MMLKSKQILQERYRLQEQLSQNPTRQTWRAEDTRTQQKVIVKLLPFSPQTQWQDIKLFEREAQILKHLDFAEIPRYLDYFSVEKELGDGLPWFALVQNYIPGSSLQQLLKSQNTFTEPVVKDIAQQLLKILIYLHELSPSVLHRDLKPSNIILGDDGKIHLVDFGAVQDKAKAEGATFTVVGTGGYAPPEQLWGKAVAASDLYALGATLIHLLTGVAPGELPQHRMRLQFRDRANVSPEFAAWLEKLIEPAVERRYASAREGLAALQVTERAKADVKVRYGRLGRLALLQYGVVGLCLLALPLFGVYRYITEGKRNVEAMNRAQQAYFLKNNEFADSLEKLGLDTFNTSRNYQYEIYKKTFFSINQVTPKRNKLKDYIGIVALNRTPAGEVITQTLVCEDSRDLVELWARYDLQEQINKGTELSCPSPLEEISGQRKIVPMDRSAQLAYLVLAEASLQNPENRALELLAEIPDPMFQVRTLDAIIPSLKTSLQLNRALTLAETIENNEAKARIFGSSVNLV